MDSNELPLASVANHNTPPATMKLIGIGGGGCNALSRLALSPLPGLTTAILDTDAKALSQHTSPDLEKILLAPALRRGLSTGGDPELGRSSAEADTEKLTALTANSDIIFLVTSLGGGTGGGAAPIIADIAGSQNALVIAFATMPFSFEGTRRAKQAEENLTELRRACDAVITLPNDLLLQQTDDSEAATDALRRADDWMIRGVRSIYSILRQPSLVNLDLAALRRAFTSRGGKTLYAFGSGTGENLITETLENLKMCPLLHIPEAARKVDHLIVNISAGTHVTLPAIKEIMNVISAQYGRDAHILMGTSVAHAQPDAIEVCLIGTTDLGTRTNTPRRPPSVKPPAPTPEPTSEQSSSKKQAPQNGPAKKTAGTR